MVKHWNLLVHCCMFRARYYASYGREPADKTVEAYGRGVRKRLGWTRAWKNTTCPYCTAAAQLLRWDGNKPFYAPLKDVVAYLVDTGVIVPQYPVTRKAERHEVGNASATATLYGRGISGDSPSVGNPDTKSEGNIFDGFDELWDALNERCEP